MSYGPEERYWTDYLRIALPVVGLLLMLGLFWYWASAVIGDDSNEPRPSPTANVAMITAAVPTPTATQPVTINVTEVTPDTTPTKATGSNGGNTDNARPTEDATEPADETPTSSEAPGQGFKVGDRVVVSEPVRLRADRSTDADIIEELDAGVELEVIEEAEEAGGYFWIGVRDVSNDQEGYVADEFVELAEE